MLTYTLQEVYTTLQRTLQGVLFTHGIYKLEASQWVLIQLCRK